MMAKNTRMAIVKKWLDHLFPTPTISLTHRDPYTLLIAVLLSAQCTDKRVNQISPLLFSRAATPEDMVRLTPQAIETIIRPCGLAPTKSKAIYALSLILLDRYQGVVPRTQEALESLPGVGHKTASVVLTQAFNIPAFPVDTHIHRCAQRWQLSSGKNVAQTEADLKNLFCLKDWGKVHLQIIHYARAHCPARHHTLSSCPICTELQQPSSLKSRPS